MFNRINKIYCLLMGNHLDSCKRDVILFKEIFKKYSTSIKLVIDCFPQKELQKYLLEKNFNINDLLIIFYSGHGQRIGKKINGKVEIISTWINPDGTYVYSYIVDKILSSLNTNIILISDSCYSGSFGHFYQGKGPFIFIGSSNTINRSDDYNFSGEPTGALVNLFEYILQKVKISDLNQEIVISLTQDFYKMKKIKIRPVLKFAN